MFEKIKSLKSEFSSVADAPVIRDSDGRAVINMTVHNDDDFLSPYSVNNTETISSEVADFLQNAAMAYHPKEKLTLRISSSCIDENEKRIYTKAIKNYFNLHFIENARELKRNTISSIIMMIIGVLGLAFMIFGEKLGFPSILIECIDIFAWVFIWETVDLFFISRSLLKLKLRRLIAFTEIKVEYIHI